MYEQLLYQAKQQHHFNNLNKIFKIYYLAASGPQLPDGMWNPPGLRLNPSPALTGGFLINGSPGRSRIFLNEIENCLVFLLLYSLHGENFSYISPPGRNIVFSFKVLPLANLEKQCFLCVQIDRYMCSSVLILADLFDEMQHIYQ